MQLTFLGTGTSQGIPVIGCHCNVCNSPHSEDKRLRTAACIEYRGLRLLIDAGPDFRQQLLREHIDHVDAILLTHQHKDHMAGLDDVRAFNYITSKPMDIYAEPRVQAALKTEFSYVFEKDKYPGIPEFALHTIGTEPFSIGPVEIIPIRVWHARLPILGFRIGPLAYITDANHIEPEELEKTKGVSVLVINAVRNEPHISHFSIPEAVALAQAVKAPRSYLTHLSHQAGRHQEIQQYLPEGIWAGYDGLRINIL